MESGKYTTSIRPVRLTVRHFDWSRFVQVELRHRQIKESLTVLLADARAEIDAASALKIGKLRVPFAVPATRAATARSKARASIREIQTRLEETDRALAANEEELHARLHEWLSETDAHYRVSFEVEDRYREIAKAIESLQKLFADLLARYGSTRNEIGVSYNPTTGKLSPAALASVERLVASYQTLMKAETVLAEKLTELNAMVERSMFKELMLPMFNLAVTPDIRPGMEYAELREHFEKSAAEAKDAIEKVSGYLNSIKTVDTNREEILRRYRAQKWEKHLADLGAAVH